jgi:hypothetical protein
VPTKLWPSQNGLGVPRAGTEALSCKFYIKLWASSKQTALRRTSSKVLKGSSAKVACQFAKSASLSGFSTWHSILEHRVNFHIVIDRVEFPNLELHLSNLSSGIWSIATWLAITHALLSSCSYSLSAENDGFFYLQICL